MASLMNQLVARGEQSAMQDTLKTFRPLFTDFAASALASDQAGARAKELGKSEAVWPKARKIMLAVQAEKIPHHVWASVVTSFMLELKLDKSSTAKSYASTLKNGPYIVQTPEAIKAHDGKPINLEEVSYTGLRNIIKGANQELLNATNPDVLKYKAVCDEIGERLRDLVKAKRENKEKGTPALEAMSYAEALQHATAILGLIPERSEKAPESETEQSAEETSEPMTRAA